MKNIILFFFFFALFFTHIDMVYAQKNNLAEIKRAQKFEEMNSRRLAKSPLILPQNSSLKIKNSTRTKAQILLLMLMTSSLITVSQNINAHAQPPRLKVSEKLDVKGFCTPVQENSSEEKGSSSDIFKTDHQLPQTKNTWLKSQLWAQEMVKAELMKTRLQEILQTSSRPHVSVPVAIIDSGLENSFLRHLKTNGTLHYKKLQIALELDEKMILQPTHLEVIKKAEAEKKSFSEHGTAVAGLIAGENIGMVSDGISLSFYDHDQILGQTDKTGNLLQKTFRQVCAENKDPEGLTLINFSMGRSSDQIIYHPYGFNINLRDEHLLKNVLADLAHEGCLIIKASGNEGYRGQHVNEIDDAFLRVEAVGRKGALSSFSSIGEVRAPGDEIWTSTLSSAFDEKNHDHECYPGSSSSSLVCHLASGTSFSAPIVTGIASSVVLVLKSEKFFQQLSPEKRISLVNRIIRHSQDEKGVVIGAEAIEIARTWNLISQARQFPLEPHFVDSI